MTVIIINAPNYDTLGIRQEILRFLSLSVEIR